MYTTCSECVADVYVGVKTHLCNILIPALRQAGYESIADLHRIQKSYKEKALVVIPPAMRICATSNGEQRVQVLIPVVQGLSQKQRQLMH